MGKNLNAEIDKCSNNDAASVIFFKIRRSIFSGNHFEKKNKNFFLFISQKCRIFSIEVVLTLF